MLFVIIFGAIAVLSTIIAVVSTNLGNRLFYEKYKIIDGMIDKYSWVYHPQKFTDDEVKEYSELKKQREKYWTFYNIFDNMVGPSVTVAIVFGILLFIILLILIFTNIPYEIKIENNKNVQNYQKLIFELDNPEVRDEFNIRTKDLIDDVTEWNKDYDTYVYRHNNLWTGWFYPSGVIEGVDRINLEDYI